MRTRTPRSVAALVALGLLAASCGDAPSDVTASTGGEDASAARDAGPVSTTVVGAEETDSADLDSADPSSADGIVTTTSAAPLTTVPGITVSSTSLPESDSSTTEPAAPTSTPAESVGDASVGCTAFETALLADDTFVLAEDEDAATATFVALLRPFGDDLAEGVAGELKRLDDGSDPTPLLALYDEADDRTVELCGFPVMSAMSAIANAPRSMFCPVDQSIETGESQDDCGLGVGPDELPCFERDGSWVDDFWEAYAPVDCETGERVWWSPRVAAWDTSEPDIYERFSEVGSAIG